MRITENTKTFAQNENAYILTNEHGVTLDNVDIIKHKGCIVDMEREIISPELPIGVLTKYDAPDWVEPDRQIKPEEIKDFRQLK